MGQNIALPISLPVNKRGRRGSDSAEEEDKPILRAMSRAFLSAVNADDRAGQMLYSRALLALINRGPG